MGRKKKNIIDLKKPKIPKILPKPKIKHKAKGKGSLIIVSKFDDKTNRDGYVVIWDPEADLNVYIEDFDPFELEEVEEEEKID